MLVKLAFAMQRLRKISENIFVMIDKDGGVRKILDFMGGTAGENPGECRIAKFCRNKLSRNKILFRALFIKAWTQSRWQIVVS